MSRIRRTPRPASALSRRSRGAIRLGLRLSARNALRARGRSILIILLVAMPVIGLTAAGTIALSMTGTVAQTVGAQLGRMSAEITPEGTHVRQTPAGQMTLGYGNSAPKPPHDWIPSRWRIVPLQTGGFYLDSAHGVASIQYEAGRTWDPAFAGRFTLTSGHAPTSATELLATPSALRRLGTRVGGTVTAPGNTHGYTIVGTMRDLTLPSSTAMVFGTFAAFPGVTETVDGNTVYYLAGPPVTLADIREFNEHGGVVQSRAVTRSMTAPDVTTAWTLLAIFAVIGSFMLIEIALLAGAAFLVGARQQQRALAVLASVGADRRVLGASVASAGIVLGAVGSLLGIGVGLLLAWGFMSLTADGSITRYYGYDTSVPALIGLFLVAVLASWISAAVPARSVTRFDIVAALRGARRPARASRLRSAVGVVIVIVGAGMTVLGGAITLIGSTENPPTRLIQFSGPTLLVVGSIELQLGAILALPTALRAVARWMTRAGSGARLASRDLARNSARSVPAIAVVMSTAFVGVFLMSTISGTEAIGAATYPWSAPLNSTIVQFETDNGSDQPKPLPVDATAASDYANEVDRVLGLNTARVIVGSPDALTTPTPKGPAVATPAVDRKALCVYDEGDRTCAEPQNLTNFGTGAKLIVGNAADLAAIIGQRPSARAIAALNAGGAVSLYPQYIDGDRVTIDWWTQKQLNDGDNNFPRKTPAKAAKLSAVLDAPAHPGEFGIVISRKTAKTLGVEYAPRFVIANAKRLPTDAQQDELNAYIDERSGAGRQVQASFTSEPGPTDNSAAVGWIIVAVAALSTLAAAVIALSLSRIEGRRDEQTLAAVGAKPATQRSIAFWQALVIAGIGSLVGGVFALVPTAALAYAGSILFAPPWVELATSVIGIPLLIAVVAFVFRRVPRTITPDRALVG